MKKRLKVFLSQDGSISNLEIPLRLRKDSYLKVDFLCYVPKEIDITATTVVKIYASATSENGDQVWTSQTHNLPYIKDEVVKNRAYSVFGNAFPKDFCEANSDIYVTIACIDATESGDVVLLQTTATLNLSIYGEGYNSSDVTLGNNERTSAQVNKLTKLARLRVNVDSEVPEGVVFNLNGYKTPLYDFYPVEFTVPLTDETSAVAKGSVMAGEIVRDVESPEVVGYQTEYLLTKNGICQRTNKYNISQASIGNYELLQLGAWEVSNNDYIEKIINSTKANKLDIDELYKIVNTGVYYVGQYPTAFEFPTKEQLNSFVEESEGRAPKRGDEISFVLQVENGVDKLYNIKYKESDGTWDVIHLPSGELAGNNDAGFVIGSNRTENQDKLVNGLVKMLLDIQNGEIKDVLVYNKNIEQIVSLITSAVLYDSDGKVSISELYNKGSDGEFSLIKVEDNTIKFGDHARISLLRGKNRKVVYSWIENGEVYTDTITLDGDIGDYSLLEGMNIVDYCVSLYNELSVEKQALQAEIARAKAEEEKKLDKTSINEEYFKDILFALNGDSGVATATYKNPVTGEQKIIELNVVNPASSTSAGLMTSEMVQALNAALKDIEALKYEGRQLQIFNTYADALLFDWSTIPTINIEDYFIVVRDESRTAEEEKGKTTKYNCINNERPIKTENSFAFGGLVTSVVIQVATETEIGGVISVNKKGYIYVEPSGAMKLVGYDELVSSINTLTTALSNEIARAKAAEEQNASAISAETARAQVEELKLENNKLDRVELPTKTSGFENDGDGTSPFARQSDLPTNVSHFTNDANYAKTSQLPTKTSQMQNDGDGTSVFARQSDLPTKLSQFTDDIGVSGKAEQSALNTLSKTVDQIIDKNTSQDTEIAKKIPQGGTLTAPLTVTGGNSATAGKIILNQNGTGQITDSGESTIFGFTSSTDLNIGHSSYNAKLSGKATRPTYNGNDLPLKSDVPTNNNQLTNGKGYITASDLLTYVYPIGSIYLTISTATLSSSPASWLGGTWERLPEGYALWTASSGAGTTISAGLPNITGSLNVGATSGVVASEGSTSGVFEKGTSYSNRLGGTSGTSYALNFNANSSNTIYGSSSTVQPPAYKVYAWKRIL